MLDEGRNACCLSGSDKRTNFFELIVGKSDGDLGGRHTKDHTIYRGGQKLNLALSTMTLGSVLVPVMRPNVEELMLLSGFEKFV